MEATGAGCPNNLTPVFFRMKLGHRGIRTSPAPLWACVVRIWRGLPIPRILITSNTKSAPFVQIHLVREVGESLNLESHSPFSPPMQPHQPFNSLSSLSGPQPVRSPTSQQTQQPLRSATSQVRKSLRLAGSQLTQQPLKSESLSG